MKRFFAILLFLSYATFSFAAENTLNNFNTSWSIVVPGKVISEPAVTSYGFSIITDAKLISSYSNSGRLLWEKPVNRTRDAKIYILPDDFILLSSDSNKKITLLNPSGCQLWEQKLSFTLDSEPSYGFDGRIFLKGNSQIECLGITGLLKWKMNISGLNDIPLQTLPDGSILAFYEKTEGGKSKGIRISPFGEQLEEITFSGEVLRAWSNTDGVFLTFTDGTAGYFSLKDNKAQNKWVLQTGNQKPSDYELIKNCSFLISQDYDDVFYLLPSANTLTMYKINPASGEIKSNFEIKNINGYNLQKISFNHNGIFVSDSTKGYYYSPEGNELWTGVFQNQNSKNSWNYQIYTYDNYLIFCGTNWTLNAYRVSQATSAKKQSQKQRNYNDYYTIDTTEYEYIFKSSISGDVTSEDRLKELKKGNYGTKEILYASELLSACEVFKNSISSNPTNNHNLSVFDIDTIGSQRIISQLTAYSCGTFINYESLFIQKLSNKTLLLYLLNGIKDFGYDPNGTVLKSLEILAKKTGSKDETIISAICDATYSVCNFMGRPAFNSRGKEILQNFMFPNYSATTRAYARETLKKISALDL